MIVTLSCFLDLFSPDFELKDKAWMLGVLGDWQDICVLSTLMGNRKNHHSTVKVLFKMLTSIKVLMAEQEDETTQRILLDYAETDAQRVVELTRYFMTIYTTPKKPESAKGKSINE